MPRQSEEHPTPNPFKAEAWCCIYCGTPDPDESLWTFFKSDDSHEKPSMAALFWMCGSCKNSRYHTDDLPYQAFCKVFDNEKAVN